MGRSKFQNMVLYFSPYHLLIVSLVSLQNTLVFLSQSLQIIGYHFLLSMSHSDIWGPSRTQSTFGFRNFVTFVDDISPCTWIFFMEERSELVSTFQTFYVEIQDQFNINIHTT